MADNFTVCVGTVGTGAWISPDGGESWKQVRAGLWAESRIFGFAVHPKQPRTLLAGADDGVYQSEDGGEHFERLNSPMNTLHVWKVAYDPTDPNTIFAGTRPAALYRSADGGRHWEKLRADMAEECPNVRIPRVTALTVDPSDHRIVWAGVEVDDLDEAAQRLEHANARQLTAKDGLDMEMAQDTHRNFEMKWAGPDDVVIDISHTGWQTK